MKEYGIYIRQYSGKPYMIHFFNDIEIAKLKLLANGKIILKQMKRKKKIK